MASQTLVIVRKDFFTLGAIFSFAAPLLQFVQVQTMGVRYLS
jgi:hypothetical protein